MRIKQDIKLLVKTARENGHSAMTMSQYLRLNLYSDPCRGWVLIAVPMPEHSPVAKLLDENRTTCLNLAALLVREELNRTGVSGDFGTPCHTQNEGTDAYTFLWAQNN